MNPSNKIAFVHDRLDVFGGAERVLGLMHNLYPDAPIFTFSYSKEHLPANFPHSYVQLIKTPKIGRFFSPTAVEELDLSSFHIIISDTSSFSKGIITSVGQKHFCYCHTPPRFLYNYEGESSRWDQRFGQFAFNVMQTGLRSWDYFTSKRPDGFLTNSINTARRIHKFYNVNAEVLYPPVVFDQKDTFVKDLDLKNLRFLVVSRLVSFKHVEMVLNAFKDLSYSLRVVGEGPDFAKLKLLSDAQDNIELLGFLSDDELIKEYNNADVLVYTSKDEDFGMTPVEALSRGCLVIGHYSGGMKEIITEGENGYFYKAYSAEGIRDAILTLVSSYENKGNLVSHGPPFTKEVFEQKLRNIVGF